MRCRKPTYIHELVGRAAVTGDTRVYNLFGFQVGQYGHTQVVDICPTCDWQETEAALRRQRRTLFLVGTATLGFFGWVTLGMWSLPAAGALAVGVVLLKRKRNQTALVKR